MSVQSSSSQDLFEGLPSIIGLPRCLPSRPAYRKTPLTQVCVSEELPPYLLLGRLDPSTFRSSDAEWSARWVGGTPDTTVDAKFDRGAQRLELRQVWRGLDGGLSCTSSEDFGPAVQLLYMPFPERWDRLMAERLEAAYRLKYVPHSADQCGFAGIPDGGFKTIGVPVPIARLADLHACFHALRRDPQFVVPAGGRLELRLGTVNHVVGRGPAWTEDPAQLFAASFEANGLLPLGLPQLEHAKSGSSAWTVRRLVYLALISVPFAGVEPLVERLAKSGLIRRRGLAEEQAEPGIEFDAFVGPAAIELLSQSIAWMDAAGTRRVFYQLKSDDESATGGVGKMMEALEQSDSEALALIRQASVVSRRQRQWLAEIVGVAECVS